MSETRAAYNAVMQPGDELDALCAVVMGYITGPIIEIIGGKGINANGDSILLPGVSTDFDSATQAWEWLEENHPWLHNREGKADLMLGRYGDDNKPAVFIMAERWKYYPEAYNGGYSGKLPNMAIVGSTYPHAIALAVVEAGKALGVIE